MIKHLLVCFGIVLAFWLMNSSCKSKPISLPPNILLIVTDDMAFGDLSLTTNPYIQTPVLDKLAQDGAFASHFYVSPVCAPTRASLLTGRYHQRTGVTGVTRGREDMNLSEPTIANVFSSFGYETGIFGKWHNGAHYPYHPLGRGFDEFVGFTSGHWSNYFNASIEKNGAPFQTKGYLTDVFTNEAIGFITKSQHQKKPFLCYVPYQTPHTPLQVPDKYFDKYKAKGVDDFNACIYGMCENIDDNVGRLLDTLDKLGIRENTIVIFLSDNGPLNERYNLGLKGKKGSNDEGGVRVPFFINWPGIIQPHTTLRNPLAHIDVLPTLLDLLNKDYAFISALDGISFASQLTHQEKPKSRFLFGEWNGVERVVADSFLLVGETLYNIYDDPKQWSDLRNKHALVYDSLYHAYTLWHKGILITDQPQKAIPVGYNAYPRCVLPAHEATLFPAYEARKDRKHTGIAYHSLYGWAHDWVDYWTSTSAYVQWQIDVVETGHYEVKLYYALAEDAVGTALRLDVGAISTIFQVNKAFVHTSMVNHDRVHRDQEAPETDWAMMNIGTMELEKGITDVVLKTMILKGSKSIELKEIVLIKK